MSRDQPTERCSAAMDRRAFIGAASAAVAATAMAPAAFAHGQEFPTGPEPIR